MHPSLDQAPLHCTSNTQSVTDTCFQLQAYWSLGVVLSGCHPHPHTYGALIPVSHNAALKTYATTKSRFVFARVLEPLFSSSADSRPPQRFVHASHMLIASINHSYVLIHTSTSAFASVSANIYTHMLAIRHPPAPAQMHSHCMHTYLQTHTHTHTCPAYACTHI
jgi:hypothetical protein